MPLVQVTLIEEALSNAQKQQIITHVQDAIAAVAGEKMRAATWVVFDEVRSEDWGFARRVPRADFSAGGMQ